MVRARLSAEWDRTSSLLALIANVNRDPKRRPVKPADFHPYTGRRRRGTPVTVAQLTDEIMKIAENRRGRS